MSSKTVVKKKAVAAKPATAKKTAAPKTVFDKRITKSVAPIQSDAPAKTVAAFEIEDNAYFPPRMRTSTGGKQYPFGLLEVGKSFFEKAEEVDPSLYTSEEEAAKDQKMNLDRVVNRVSGAKRRFMKANPGQGYVFAIRTLNDPAKGLGVRVRREA